MQLPWESFQLDIRDLFVDKLSKSLAQAYWRTNSPTHFGGATGTFTAIEEVRTGPGCCNHHDLAHIACHCDVASEHSDGESHWHFRWDVSYVKKSVSFTLRGEGGNLTITPPAV